MYSSKEPMESELTPRQQELLALLRQNTASLPLKRMRRLVALAADQKVALAGEVPQLLNHLAQLFIIDLSLRLHDKYPHKRIVGVPELLECVGESDKFDFLIDFM